MSKLPMYAKAAVLNRDKHRHLRIAPAAQPFAFARSINSVPVVAIEFAEACKHYPIVFAKNDAGSKSAVAMFGLLPKTNPFVDAKGQWGCDYIPAFVRRYPFVLAEGKEQHTVCIDSAFEGLNEKAGNALFLESGEPSDFLSKTLAFIEQHQANHKATEQFVQRLETLGLLDEMTAGAEFLQGERVQVNGLWVVNEERLRKLSVTQQAALVQSGDLLLIHAHLISLGNLKRLAARIADSRQAA